MQLIQYLFIFCLALGAACGGSDNKPRHEIPEESDTTQVEDTARQEASLGSQSEISSQNNNPDTLYRISGTEPFWSMVVARPQIIYTSADGDTLRFDYKEARQASGRQEGYVQVFELDEGQQLLMRRTDQCPCSDGMSDREYPYQATLILKEKVMEGCGRTP